MNDHQTESDDDQVEHEEITLETLSSPPVHVEPAPVTSRTAAALLDSLLMSGIWIGLRFAGGEPLLTLNPSALYSPSTLMFTLVVFLYYWLTEWLLNASPGKILFGLRVYLTDGNPCDLIGSLKRNLLRFIDWLPAGYLMGTILILLSEDRQRLGDRWANSVVTKAPEKDINPPPAPFLFH